MIILIIIFLQPMMPGGLPLGVNNSTLSPRVASPNPDGSNMLAPHQLHQARLSPLSKLNI